MDLPSYPSTARNKIFISEVLRSCLPKNGTVLETASGTGEHISFFCEEFPKLVWQPSDKSNELFWAIRERTDSVDNVKKPVVIDLLTESFRVMKENYVGVVNINMIHIAPWDACLGLFRLAREVISPDGFVYLYGPFKVGGSHSSVSNKKFDVSLRDRNSSWGVRNLEDVISLAKNCGFFYYDVHEMPVNNKSVIFKKNNQANITVKTRETNRVLNS